MKPSPNKLVAFIGPYVAVLSGVVVDWLFVHLHFLAEFHTQRTALTAWLTQALVFGLTAILTYAGQQKWLSGWIAWENSEATAGPDLQPIEGAQMTETEPVDPTLPQEPEPMPDSPGEPELPEQPDAPEPPPPPPPPAPEP